MDEDIKILEEYIDTYNGALKLWQIDELNECEDLRQAIENLLKRYKELEKENKKIKNSNDTLKGFVSSIFNDTFEKDFIPTSVIQNKIDEIQEQYEETLKTADFKEIETMNKTNFRGIILEGQRIILKELIEESNK